MENKKVSPGWASLFMPKNHIINEKLDIELSNGYHLAKLPKELEVDTCTIVIHKSKNVPVEGESKELDMGNLGPEKIYNYTKTEPGRCYIMIDGKWVDTASEEAKEKLDIDYIPGDICMPVLYN